MKKWILKAVIQKTISFLPYKHQINHLFQKYITKGVVLSDDYFEDKLIHFQKHQKYCKAYLGERAPTQVLEIGTGWYPIIPLCFFLTGSEQIHTIDITRLMTKEKLLTSLQKFVMADPLNLWIEVDDLRWKTLKRLVKEGANMSFEELLEALHVNYLIADAQEPSFSG